MTAAQDGWARVWDVDSRNCVGRLQPFGGATVTRAFFLAKPSGGSTGGEAHFLVTGGNANSEVKMWRAWTTLTPVLTQSLVFRAADDRVLSIQLEVREREEEEQRA